MKRLSCIAGSIALLMAASMQAFAVADELSAAYCSGGGHGVIGANGLIGPPGLLGGPAFAAPVIATGAVEVVSGDPMTGTFDVEIGDVPAAKFPAETPVVSFVGGVPTFFLLASQSDHPSAAHCRGAIGLP